MLVVSITIQTGGQPIRLGRSHGVQRRKGRGHRIVVPTRSQPYNILDDVATNGTNRAKSMTQKHLVTIRPKRLHLARTDLTGQEFNPLDQSRSGGRNQFGQHRIEPLGVVFSGTNQGHVGRNTRRPPQRHAHAGGYFADGSPGLSPLRPDIEQHFRSMHTALPTGPGHIGQNDKVGLGVYVFDQPRDGATGQIRFRRAADLDLAKKFRRTGADGSRLGQNLKRIRPGGRVDLPFLGDGVQINVRFKLYGDQAASRGDAGFRHCTGIGCTQRHASDLAKIQPQPFDCRSHRRRP